MNIPQDLSFGRIDKQEFSDLGVAVSDGSRSFKILNDPKDVYSYDWAGYDGIQYDLTVRPNLKARVFYIQGWLLANSENDFIAKWDALELILRKNEAAEYFYNIIYCRKYRKNFAVKFKSMTDFENPYPVQGTGKIGIQIRIEFDEIMGIEIDPEEYPIDPISKIDQYISMDDFSGKTTSSPPFNSGAWATSGLPVTLVSSNTDVATVSGNIITIVGSGSTNITASQAGNADYNAATNVVKPLIVTDANDNIYYGPSNGEYTTIEELETLTKIPFTANLILNTGTTKRFFTVALRGSKTINTVSDLDAGIFNDIKSSYKLNDSIIISGVLYAIYTMEIALPYSTNHRHEFNFI